MRILNHYVVLLKQIQYCTSIILQLKENQHLSILVLLKETNKQKKTPMKVLEDYQIERENTFSGIKADPEGSRTGSHPLDICFYRFVLDILPVYLLTERVSKVISQTFMLCLFLNDKL